MLQQFIELNRDEIVRRCRRKVAERSGPAQADAVIDHGVPAFLDQLVDVLRLGQISSPEIGRSAVRHAGDLLRRGCSVSQVVHDYGDVCQAITELALEARAPIGTEDFQTLNRCLDDAIAHAVTEYGRARTETTAERETGHESERLGFLAHELRNLINTAILAFEVLETGNVGVLGSTGTVLRRSLTGLRALVGRSLAEVRLTQGVQHREPFLVSEFLDELAPAATLEATASGIALTVMPVDAALAIEADRQILAAVVSNLLQNAFKFTRPHGTVILRVNASPTRVRLEIQDECGGLPDGDVDELFRPFEQRDAKRTGLGLGLAFSRWGVEANHGHIHARDLPGHGCVFTIDLPRLSVPAFATT